MIGNYGSLKQIDWRRAAPRITFDIALSVLAVGLAFAVRAFVYSVYEPHRMLDGMIVSNYNKHFIKYSPLFALVTVAVFWFLNFYRDEVRGKEPWRPIQVIAGVSAAMGLFAIIMYFLAPTPKFSRGVMLLIWGFSMLFLAAPRILKFFIFRKVAFEVGQRKRGKPQRILVIGGAGYVGSQLVRDLVKKGIRVRVLDSMLFGDKPIADLKEKIDVTVGDFRNVETLVGAMRGMDAVVHLGGIVGDPACSLDDDFTIDVNLTATTLVAETCKIFKIERFVFASTCSVYGQADKGQLTEESKLNPVSLYAKTKIASENVLKDQTSLLFQPTILRFSTLFGLSPRPRFDLVVNILTGKAILDKKIHVFGGQQWRPFVHVKDTAKAIIAVLEAPINKVGGQVFNVGSAEMNFRILDVGKKVAEMVEGTELIVDDSKEDARNYKVSFDKLESTLGIKLERDLEYGINEMKEAFARGEIGDFTSPEYSNVVQTEKVLSDFVNHVEADVASALTHHKKTAKSLLRQVPGSK